MGAERRRASRVPINVTLSLNGISDENDACEQKDISVETVDISKGGIAFITKRTLKKGTFYNTSIQMPNHEILDVVIEIVRQQPDKNGEIMYGSRFCHMRGCELSVTVCDGSGKPLILLILYVL